MTASASFEAAARQPFRRRGHGAPGQTYSPPSSGLSGVREICASLGASRGFSAWSTEPERDVLVVSRPPGGDGAFSCLCSWRRLLLACCPAQTVGITHKVRFRLCQSADAVFWVACGIINVQFAQRSDNEIPRQTRGAVGR